MKTLKRYNIETRHALFVLTLYEQSDGDPYMGQYYGTTPKYAASQVRPGERLPTLTEVGQGEITGSDPDDVAAQCRAEIEELDGEIIRTIEVNP